MKKVLLLAILALGVTSSRAEALYWMVDTGAADAAYTGNDVGYAGLYSFVTASTPSSPINSKSVGVTEVEFVEALDGGVSPLLSDIGTGTGMSFFIELFNASGESLHATSPLNYTELLQSGYVSTGGISVPSFAAGSAFNGAAVPEPSGGLLLMMGGALLALRRRRG